MDEDMKVNANISYLIRAAHHSKYNAGHWFRYLRKEIVNGKVRLSPDEISALVASDELTIFQKITLKCAMTVGTPTYSYIDNLNKPAKLKVLGEFLRNHGVNDAPPVKICKPIKTFSNLKLIAPPLEYIAGMKLVSGREQDIKDVAAILVKLEIDNLENFRKTLNKFNFRSIDDSLILEAFGIAYGMEWLERYYNENEDAIVKLIDQNSSDYYDNSLKTKQTLKGKKKSTQSAH